eukprot:TRINITY_DN49947_c0_g1_i1.p1 TRINITY_DN49947_c0_g1~~TRINITY_DN49947_c0_g1_i1.p1  ORF type:complete len:473 (-),score=106.44 TRINITY_DN49947_c0_g1_i1:157-1575(-)
MASFIDKIRGKSKSDDSSRKMLTVFDQMNAESPEDIAYRKDHPAEEPLFNTIVALTILVNSVMLGFEVDYGRGTKIEDRLGFFLFDMLFFVFFLGEMLLRQQQLGWDYFVDPWNFFDYILLVLNCADISVAVSSQDASGLKLASAVRILRLLRVVRNIRGLKMFYGLWIVIQGMLDSLRTMLWVGTLLLLIVYCVAIALTTFVGQSDFAKDRWRYAELYFGSVYRSMWTVLQLMTFDAWASDIARPLAEVSPLGTAVLFLTIVICSFGVLNVIVAVMVERTLTIARENKDRTAQVLAKSEQELLKSIEKAFSNTELDENEEVDFEQFTELIQSPQVGYKLRLLGIQASEASGLFELMDADRSGKVSPEEFGEGLKKLRGPAKGEDLVTLICKAQQQSLRASRFVDRVKKLSEKADRIQDRLDEVGAGITEELRGRKEAGMRSEKVWKQAKERERVIQRLDIEKQLTYPGLAG